MKSKPALTGVVLGEREEDYQCLTHHACAVSHHHCPPITHVMACLGFEMALQLLLSSKT
jgi:hypothetical protein